MHPGDHNLSTCSKINDKKNKKQRWHLKKEEEREKHILHNIYKWGERVERVDVYRGNVCV